MKKHLKKYALVYRTFAWIALASVGGWILYYYPSHDSLAYALASFGAAGFVWEFAKALKN